ncbi:hypothetical protein ABIB25_005342 [Nakamurella sp. UYEF19]|uniref:hypothetical protein n=1 Tax=Nakamurella sp. UYEF19 TaxID=1756392 RepID=UPI00339B29A0
MLAVDRIVEMDAVDLDMSRWRNVCPIDPHSVLPARRFLLGALVQWSFGGGGWDF